jgi:hypothetical protein
MSAPSNSTVAFYNAYQGSEAAVEKRCGLVGEKNRGAIHQVLPMAEVARPLQQEEGEAQSLGAGVRVLCDRRAEGEDPAGLALVRWPFQNS